MDADAFKERLETLNMSLGFGADYDGVGMMLTTLSENRDAAFEMARLALAAPRFDAARPHQMRSLTKSVIALLAGIAADRHAFDPRAPIVPQLGYDALANPDPRKARITTLDLLSHRSGLACNDYDGTSPGNEVRLYEAPDWVKAFLDLPMATDPNTVAHYCSGGMFTTDLAKARITAIRCQ